MKLQNIRKKSSFKPMAENLELKKWKTTSISLKKTFIEAQLVVTEAGKSHLTNQKFFDGKILQFPHFLNNIFYTYISRSSVFS